MSITKKERDAAALPPPPPERFHDHAALQDVMLHDHLHPGHAAYGHQCSPLCRDHLAIIRLGTDIFPVEPKSRVGEDIIGYTLLGGPCGMWTQALAICRRVYGRLEAQKAETASSSAEEARL